MAEIIALGGGGFSMEESPALDLYILSQSRRTNPKVCFLPTASGDSDDYISRFYTALSQMPCQPIHLSLFKTPPMNCEQILFESDI
jgi:peptidase E